METAVAIGPVAQTAKEAAGLRLMCGNCYCDSPSKISRLMLSRRFFGKWRQVVGHDLDDSPVLPQQDGLVVLSSYLGGASCRSDHGFSGSGHAVVWFRIRLHELNPHR
jgi:hypothetical protein